jgi:hypothetical protein
MKRRLIIPCIPRQEATVSVLQKEILLLGSKGRKRCLALFDSGASFSVIRRDVAESLQPLTPLADPEEWVFETARAGDLIQARFTAVLDFRFDDSKARFHTDFIVFDECSEEVIIGAQTLQANHIILDFDKEEITYRKTAEKLRII